MTIDLKVPVPGEQFARLLGVLLVVLFLISVVALIWFAGKRSEKQASTEDQLQVTEQSAGITRHTADTVAAEQAGTWKAAQADEGAIRARIDAQPRAAGPADPDVLRIARAAHARAECSARRLQREGCGDDAAASPE